jgi:hypothetical protein
MRATSGWLVSTWPQSWPKPVSTFTTGRETGLMDQPGKFQQGGRALFRGFQHHGAARRQCRAQLDGRQKQLGIPRHDGSNHANRFAAQEGFHIRLIHRQAGTLNLVGQTGVIAVILGHIANLAACFADDLAGIRGFQLGQLVGMLSNQVGQLVQQLARWLAVRPAQAGSRKAR